MCIRYFARSGPIAPVSIWGRYLGGASSRRYFPKSWPAAGEAVPGNRPYVGIAPSQGVLGMVRRVTTSQPPPAGLVEALNLRAPYGCHTVVGYCSDYALAESFAH